MSTNKKLAEALEERLGDRTLIDATLNERIPGGASWAYVFGSVTLILFLVQLGTGLVLAMYYSPSTTDAWASVAYLEQKIAMGGFVRGLHHHASGGMVVMAVVHMIQVVWFGAYKRPREVNWLTGLGLLGLVLAFALTGYLLPWDQTGYWATKVATSIAGTVPVIGESLQRIAQGGNDYGNLTLTRFYAVHVILLPLLTIGLMAVHLYLFRRHGVTPSPTKSKQDLRMIVDFFWPKQVAYDAAAAVLVLTVLFGLAFGIGAPLEAPADPASTFIARPEWYFLFLFELLKYFDGPLQVVGTVIIPGLAAAFLILLPFLDRGAERRVRARWPWVGAIALGLLAVVVLTGLALGHDAQDPTIAKQKKRSEREAERALVLAQSGVPPAGAGYMMAHDPLTRGERVFWRECATCHALEGEVPKEPKGPELTGYASRAWIRQVLRDADSPRLFGRTKIEGMESFAKLDAQTLTRLVNLVYERRQPDAVPIAQHPDAGLVEEHECDNCHEFEAWESYDGPSLQGYQSRTWLRRLIDNPADDALYGEDNEMPIFGRRLSQEDQAAVVEFLLSLEHRADPEAWPYVDDPGPVPSVRAPTREDRPSVR